MLERLLVLAVRYAAIFALALALALILVRWRFPLAREASRKGPSYWREIWRIWRRSKAKEREREDNLRAVRGKSVLVVDPDEKSSKVLIWRLEGLGCKVKKARTGSQAVGLAPSVDAVISDALLPDVSAVDFCNSLAALQLPIVLVGVLRAQRDELARFGNVACLGKPFDPEDAAALAGRMIRERHNVITS